MATWQWVLIVAYGLATLIHLGVLWDHATKSHLTADVEQRRKQRAARMTLFFPLWLPWYCLEFLWWLIKTAWGVKKRPEVSELLCPECRQKMSRGPYG